MKVIFGIWSRFRVTLVAFRFVNLLSNQLHDLVLHGDSPLQAENLKVPLDLRGDVADEDVGLVLVSFGHGFAP